eukprot:403368445
MKLLRLLSVDNLNGVQTDRNIPQIQKRKLILHIQEDLDEEDSGDWQTSTGDEKFSQIQQLMHKLPSVQNFTPGKLKSNMQNQKGLETQNDLISLNTVSNKSFKPFKFAQQNDKQSNFSSQIKLHKKLRFQPLKQASENDLQTFESSPQQDVANNNQKIFKIRKMIKINQESTKNNESINIFSQEIIKNIFKVGKFRRKHSDS